MNSKKYDELKSFSVCIPAYFTVFLVIFKIITSKYKNNNSNKSLYRLICVSCRTVAFRRPESYSATHKKRYIYCAEKVAHGLDLISPYFYFVR